MAGRQYGFIGNRDGFFGALNALCIPVDDLTTGEKTPVPKPFNAGDVIHNVYVHVITFEVTGATREIDVGLDGTAPDDDPDGFLDAVVTGTAAGVKQGLLVGTDTLGALLKEDTNGSAVNVRKPHIITQADAKLTYTLASAHTELVADIYAIFFRLPVNV